MGKATRYEIVGTEGQTLTGAIRDLVDQAHRIGCTVIGLKPAKSPSGIPLREEIANQPIFDTLQGPSYGGPGLVRYETKALYARLSQ